MNNNVFDFNGYYEEKERAKQPVIVKSELVADYNRYVDQIESLARRYVQRAKRIPPRHYLWITVGADKKVVWPIYECALEYQLCLGCDGVIYAVYEHGVAEEYGLLKRMTNDCTAPDSVVLRDMNKLAELIENLKSEEFDDKFTTAGQQAVDREHKTDPSLMPGKRKPMLKRALALVMPYLIVAAIVFIAVAIFLSFLYGKYVGW